MDDLLLALLDALDAVGENHEEIFATVCSERMGDPIFYLFIKPDAEYVVPDEFGLPDAAANLAVKQALVDYTTAAKSKATQLGINSFHDRLAAFQNYDVASTRKGNGFDDYFGWMKDTFPECGKPIDLETGANLDIDRTQIPIHLQRLVPYVEKWSFENLQDQDIFVAKMQRYRPEEVKQFNNVFDDDTQRLIGEWSKSLPFHKHISEFTPNDWAHPYWAFLHVLKLREVTGGHENNPAILVIRERMARNNRAIKFSETTTRADHAFRNGNYSGYIELLEEFEDLLTATQQKKMALARRKSQG